jgi:hypothetical protein
MCDAATGLPALHNADECDERTVVVAVRGACTFGEKALVAHEAGAAGILFVNDQEGLMHPSGPEARDVELSAALITKHDGRHLVQALQTVAETRGPEYRLNGRFVQISCRNSNSDSSYCKPVNHDDARFEARLDYRGSLHTEDGGTFDFEQGDFGSWLDPHAVWETMVPSVIGGDVHCCKKAGFEDDHITNTTAMLCLRGDCDFLTKSENIAMAGAGLLVVSSHNETLTRMGAEPPWRGRKVMAATLMASSEAYEEMVTQFYTQLDDRMPSSIRLTLDDVCESGAFDEDPSD